ncbi:MAG: hypothetical protein J5585_03805 [Clostridia bacterium]|nr:hypothetical protein [Clostridia bacterium]
MKKIVSVILLLAVTAGLCFSLSNGVSALTAQLDALQINSSVIYQSSNLANAKGFTIKPGDKVYIIGWIAFSSTDGLKEIRYVINGKEYACQDNYRDRPDLAGHNITSYNNGKHAGYGDDVNMMELTGIGSLAPGSYTLTLRAYSNGGKSTDFRTYTLKVEGTSLVRFDAMQLNSGVLGAADNIKDAARVTLRQGDKVYVTGWASFVNSDKLKSVSYLADGVEHACDDNYRNRPDVYASGIPIADNGSHGGFGYDDAMFELTGIGSLPVGEHRITLRAASDGGQICDFASFIVRVAVSEEAARLGLIYDVNGDGSVDNLDVVALFKYVSGSGDADERASDCNRDGSVDNVDVVALFKYVSGGGSPVSDSFAGTPAYTESGDSITAGGVTYPNTTNMKNGVLYATDDLGRELTLDSGSYTADGTKNVGLFYFLWMGEHGDYGIYDITKILQTGGEAAKKASYSGWGAVGAMHFWGEPLYGYYFSSDTWVMRKHIEMLTAAEIDFLYIDATNGYPYINNAKALMKIMHEYNEQGYRAPKIVFYTHSSCESTVNQLYTNIYSKNVYPDTWLYVDGKPLIIAYESKCQSNLSSATYNFFSYREPQWPNEAQKTNGWPWMDFNYPQRAFINKSGKKEAMSVSVAQHSGTVRFSDSAIYGDRTNRGRSFANGSNNDSEGATLYGYNFEEQFEYAINSGVPYILVTGWNEWVAQRQPSDGNSNNVVFVDTCSMEFSRDLEPMKGGYFDNYYMQLIELVRRYKGSAPALIRDMRKPVDITGDFSQWDDVAAPYTDPAGDTQNRSARGFGNKTLTNSTGANDIVSAKIVYDTKYIYFYAETASEITARGNDRSWMQLFIDADQDGGTGFYGFDYIVNYKTQTDAVTTLAKIGKNGSVYSVQSTELINYKVDGNKIMIRVPLSSIGIYDCSDIMIAFKWVDGTTNVTSMEQMYTDGDVAPLGRLSYTFRNHK